MRSLLFFFAGILLAVASLQAQVGKQASVIVLEPKEVSGGASILTPALKTLIREEIGRTLNTDAYIRLGWENLAVLETIQAETSGPTFDAQKVAEIGKRLGASKVIFSEALQSPDGYYLVYTKQLDVETAVVDKQGSGKIRCKEHLALAARQAATVFSKHPEAELQKVEKEIRRACPEASVEAPTQRNLLQEIFCLKMPANRFGLEISYDQLERQGDPSDRTSGRLDYWGQPALLGGRFGFRYDRYLAPRYAGLGISTGLSLGYYSLSNKPSSVVEEALRFQEVTVRVPVKGIWRLDFSRNIGAYVEYGLSANLSLYSRIDADNRTYTNIYYDDAWGLDRKRLTFTTLAGAGIQVDHLLLGASTGRSFLPNQADDSPERIRERTFSLSLTLMF